ncbi:MAG: hypothetical protein ACE5FZ_04965 [Nitrospiria bacterium]
MEYLMPDVSRKIIGWASLAIFFVGLSAGGAEAFVAKESYKCDAPESKGIATKIEMVLAKKKWKKKKKEIKKAVILENSQLKVRLKFFPFLDPPTNLGIGKCVSAENGRLAIEKALKYNRGVDFVIMQEFMPHHWVKIGATDLAELTWIAITPDDLMRLSEPGLSTEQFQELYRKLATLRKRELPFGMGTREIEVEPGK